MYRYKEQLSDYRRLTTCRQKRRVRKKNDENMIGLSEITHMHVSINVLETI